MNNNNIVLTVYNKRFINNCVMEVLTCKANKTENERKHLLFEEFV